MRDMSKYKKVVVKIGSSSITHQETGGADLIRIEKLVRELTDLHNRGLDVALVSSGAISVGLKGANIKDIYYDGKIQPGGKVEKLMLKQAASAIGQARLMMIYQKFFAEYNQMTAQILMTKGTMNDNLSRFNVRNTFRELLQLGVIPVVNENDAVSTYEIQFGDNDTLSAFVSYIIEADLLILLSDIDGLYTDDPRTYPDARFISCVEKLDSHYDSFGKGSTGSLSGTGGMETKLRAAHIATESGAAMIIANARDLNVIHRIMDGEETGTLFKANKNEDFDITDFCED